MTSAVKQKSNLDIPAPGALLGIECGGTRTTALLVTATAAPIIARLGPANLRLLSDSELVKRFGQIRAALNAADAELAGMAIGMAGARTEADRCRIRKAAEQVWPGVPCHVTNDLETGLLAASNAEQASWVSKAAPKANQTATSRVLILSGTGSCCFGRDEQGKTFRFGGWGHILGDGGSGYDLGLRALRAVIYDLDATGKWSALGQRILRTAQLNEPIDLIDWARNADKTGIAALATTVFEAAGAGDKIARKLLADTADELARDGIQCARLGVKKSRPVEFVLAGGLLKNQPLFAKQVAVKLVQLWPKASVKVLKGESAWGAIELARQYFEGSEPAVHVAPVPAAADVYVPTSLNMSPTEQRNPRSLGLDKMPLSEAIELFASEDASIPAALLKEKSDIEQAITLIVKTIESGGRLFYIGAGTSGRLGVLDASEIPPTFRANPEVVQGIMAGGYQALWRSVEGAEDDPIAGAAAIQSRGVSRKDLVIGIAASGRTPFVWGALGAARKIGALTGLLCFNPYLDFAPGHRPDVVIAPNVGPEILTGSTRLKAGTATKLVLNMMTTLAMVRLGKVMSNLMIDLNPSNAKLRDRAIRIVQAISGVERAEAQQVLEDCGWIVKKACAILVKAED